MFADTGALCTRGFVLSVDVVVRSVTEVAFSEQLIIRVSSLGVDVLGLSVEDDVSDGLLRGVEKEPNSTSVCVPKSPVGVEVGVEVGVHWIYNVDSVHIFLDISLIR